MPKQYDKIIHENFDSLVDGIIRKVLGLNLKRKRNLELKLQRTVEREPDFLFLAEDEQIGKHTLQIEFQSRNDKEMLERNLEYGAMTHRKTGLPFRQYVIYVGKEKMNMQCEKHFPDFTYRYHLIDIQSISYKEFIDSKSGEEILLAILCNFQGEDAEVIVRRIMSNLHKLAGENSAIKLRKYLRQLRILGQLRDLQPIIDKHVEMGQAFPGMPGKA